MTKKSQTVLKAYRLSNKKKHNMNKVMLSHNKKFKCSKRVSVKNRAKRVTFDINAIDIKSESTTICNRDVFQFFFGFLSFSYRFTYFQYNLHVFVCVSVCFGAVAFYQVCKVMCFHM